MVEYEQAQSSGYVKESQTARLKAILALTGLLNKQCRKIVEPTCCIL